MDSETDVAERIIHQHLARLELVRTLADKGWSVMDITTMLRELPIYFPPMGMEARIHSPLDREAIPQPLSAQPLSAQPLSAQPWRNN